MGSYRQSLRKLALLGSGWDWKDRVQGGQGLGAYGSPSGSGHSWVVGVARRLGFGASGSYRNPSCSGALSGSGWGEKVRVEAPAWLA